MSEQFPELRAHMDQMQRLAAAWSASMERNMRAFREANPALFHAMTETNIDEESSMSNHVEQITVTVTLANGDQHTLTENRPDPRGDNPRFLAQQIAAGMGELGERLDRLADLYADQIRA